LQNNFGTLQTIFDKQIYLILIVDFSRSAETLVAYKINPSNSLQKLFDRRDWRSTVESDNNLLEPFSYKPQNSV